ncbi:MAG: 23S rRNA (adenine(2030)-N(6))-methyltransferase RlmJ [Pseudomonadota bacterium]
MLSYRHAFHAGNHADVLKHLVLLNTLYYATRKDAPVFYLDTHSGAGLYYLDTEEAKKTGEAEQGVLKLNFTALMQQLDGDNQVAVRLYHEHISQLLQRRQYPGSPLLASSLLRHQDHLHLCELHPADFDLLQKQVRGDDRIRYEKVDGYVRALTLLPPAQKRAVVLIDPSYEASNDYRDVVKLVADIYHRMRGAQILLWYPVVERGDFDYMMGLFNKTAVKDLWQFELGIAPDSSGHGLTASGMLVVNPPYTLPGQLRAILPLVQQQLAPAYGHWSVKNLISE